MASEFFFGDPATGRGVAAATRAAQGRCRAWREILGGGAGVGPGRLIRCWRGRHRPDAGGGVAIPIDFQINPGATASPSPEVGPGDQLRLEPAIGPERSRPDGRAKRGDLVRRPGESNSESNALASPGTCWVCVPNWAPNRRSLIIVWFPTPPTVCGGVGTGRNHRRRRGLGVRGDWFDSLDDFDGRSELGLARSFGQTSACGRLRRRV